MYPIVGSSRVLPPIWSYRFLNLSYTVSESAEFIGSDDLKHIFVIADPSYPIASLTIREKPMCISTSNSNLN